MKTKNSPSAQTAGVRMSKDYILMTFCVSLGINKFCLLFSKNFTDNEFSSDLVFALNQSKEQPVDPFNSFKIDKETAELFCKDLMSLFD